MRTTENYEYLYDALERYYQMSVVGDYPNNPTLDEYGRPRYKYESKLELIDLDKQCTEDLITGEGFIIKKSINLNPPKGQVDTGLDSEKNIDTIFSNKYGLGLDDMTPFGDVYKCQCGRKMMKINNGLICPICHTKVKYVSSDFSVTGWIKIDPPYAAIHPALFKKINSLIGNKNLDAILQYNPKIGEDGFNKDEVKTNKTSPFAGIGMIDFQERFDEIIAYYRDKNKSNQNKMDFYKDIVDHRDIVFTHSIPVYTSQLRPYSIKGSHFNFEGNNALFNVIAGISMRLNKSKSNSRGKKKPTNILLYNMQMKLMQIYADLETIIAQKKGYVRSLNGGRYNFSARNVIIPDPELRIDEIILPYSTLIELLSLTIINILTKSYNPADAYRIWDEARIKYNPVIADLIQSILDSQYVGIILNRNPSISPASIIQLRCVGVSKEGTYSCHVPHEILASMGADFDGDTLNELMLINEEILLHAARLFNPRLSMQISYNDGMFNRNMSIQTDTMICVNSMSQLGIDVMTPEEEEMIYACQNYRP